MKYKVIAICVLFSAFSCVPARRLEKKIVAPVRAEKITDEVQREADDIFMLLAFSLVYHDWQSESTPRDSRRGYNIGAVLVNKNNEPVSFDLNSINSTANATQHGEVRLIFDYIAKTKSFNLDGFTIYTTLEPCVMCAGMMTMTSVKRVVYGQQDVEYSHAFERLAMDTRPIGGFGPYPRTVANTASTLFVGMELDSLYRVFLATEKEKILSKFLASEKAREVFAKAPAQLLAYSPRHEPNRTILDRVLAYYRKMVEPGH